MTILMPRAARITARAPTSRPKSSATPRQGRLNYDVGHETRRNLGRHPTANVEPVKFKTFDAGLGFERSASRSRGGLSDVNFNDVRRNNGTIDNSDDRDRGLTLLGGKLGYEFSPNTFIVLGGS